MSISLKKTVSILLCLQLIFLPSLPLFAGAETPEKVQAKQHIRIAVLNFKNISGKTNLEYLGPSIAESLSTKLVQNRGLALVEREQLELAMKELKLQGTGLVQENDIVKLGQFLGAENIIYGSVTQFETLIQINCRILDVKKGVVVFGKEVSGYRESEVPVLIDKIAIDVINFLIPVVEETAKPTPTPKPLIKPPVKPLETTQKELQGKDVKQPTTSGRGLRRWGFILMSAGTACLLLSSSSSTSAYVHYGNYSDASSEEEAVDARTSAENSYMSEIGSGITGAALLVGGLTFYLIGRYKASSSVSLIQNSDLKLALSKKYTGVEYKIRF